MANLSTTIAASAVCAVILAPRSALAEPGLVSDDRSLDRAMEQYRTPRADGDRWSTPCLPEARPSVESGDALAARAAAYRRADLDRGGWVNPFAPGAASGNALLDVAIGSGVTTPGLEPEGAAVRVAGAE